jgi:hypothetical protein
VDLPAPALPRFSEPTPGWRKAALVAGTIAAVELIALVVVALAFIAKPFADDGPAKATAQSAAEANAEQQKGGDAVATVQATKPGRAAAAALPRMRTRVLVLNGNGYVGAASEKAAVVTSLRYPVTRVGDAPRRNFPRTIVMYRTGFLAEAQRLAKDLGMPKGRAIPVDGMRPVELGGAHLVLVVGNKP